MTDSPPTDQLIVADWMGYLPDGRICLKAQRCRECSVCLWPPASHCKACGSAGLDAIELGPDAELYSITVDRTGTFLGYPHLVGQVQFAQGTFAQGFVVGEVDDPPAIGAAVELVPFELPGAEAPLVTYGFHPR